MKTLLKDNVKEIKNTYKRFLSILLIALLGVGFYAGIKATSPDMKKTLDKYFDDTNVMDLQIVSTLGLNQNDIDKIKQVEQIDKIVPSYSKDALVNIENEEIVVKLHSYTKDINQLVLKEGNLPEEPNECVVEKDFLSLTGKNIGDVVEVFPEKVEGEEEEFLIDSNLKIVGVVESPMYISMTRGSTKLGSGTIDCFMYINEENINSDIYTEIYLTVKDTKKLSTHEDKYDELIEEVTNELEQIALIREEGRYNEILEEANNKIQEAQDKLDEEKQKAETEINDARNKIENAKITLRNSKNELYSQQIQAEEEFRKAEEQLNTSSEELKVQEEEFNKRKETELNNINQAENTVEELKSNLKTITDNIETLTNNKIQIENNISNLKAQLVQLNEQLENTQDLTQIENIKSQIEQINLNIVQLENNKKTIEENINQLQINADTLNSNIQNIEQQIQTGKTELANAENMLVNARQQINEGYAQLENEKKEAYRQIANGRQSITDAEQELSEQEAKLNEESASAEEKINEAQEELDKAKEDLRDIKKPNWYVLDRNTNVGFVNYTNDSERIANIGKVFPVVFFVVAALISLTSMTRMVEEQRVEIGTLKALGYNKLQIASKYIIYATLATVTGSILGMLIGFRIIPDIIMDMYKMMYTLPDAVLEFNTYYAVTGLLVAIACIVGATIISCIKELKVMPAVLMRPKTPKAGKRVLLEKIPFIWSKLKFTQKVTIRNIFRYKKRFLMTIIGICGCTALIVAGFGLRDAVSYIIPSQYGEIFKYQINIGLKDKITKEETDEIYNQISNMEGITQTIKGNMQAIDIVKNDNEQDIQLIVPEDKEKLNDFVELKSRTKDEKYQLDDNSVIITEKLATSLDIKKGDKIILKNTDDLEVEVEVSNITENYLLHYIYMSPEYYKQIFNESVDYNVIFTKTVEMTSEQEDVLGKQILDTGLVSSVEYSSVTRGMFDDTMNNLTFVVWVLIIAAGLLAFVVLYNLSNVNISERIRELATIKVLGFYDGEVYKYVGRETTILTVIGMLIGLVAGYFLTLFIIKTCEVDMFMFDRRINITSYIYGAAITLIFSNIVSIVTYFALKKIDMVESLKSVE